MAEELVKVDDRITLCAERLGDPAAPPVLLVCGLGQQLMSWPDAFCERLLEQRLQVIRFDNRDVGRSTRLTEVRPPGLRQFLTRSAFDPRQYDLTDMAGDAAGLIDAFGLGPVHVVGVSMGGMVGQTLAARHPDKVASLTSIMSTTGHRRVGRPALSTQRLLMRRPARTREQAIEMGLVMFRHIGSHGHPFDEDYIRERIGHAFDRGHHPAGVARQIGAILKSGDRTAQLRTITAPTLVIHGDRDLMVHPSGGKATADAIPGARHVTVEGMGHDLNVGLWPRLVELIAAHVASVPAPTTAA